jgi:hypothetical protein
MLAKKEHEKRCPNCHVVDCHGDKQRDFDALQLQSADSHDQMLVDSRMLGVASSLESRKLTLISSSISNHMQSDYCLQRVVATFNKAGSFLEPSVRASSLP